MRGQSKYQLATYAGGCFWCTEAIFQRLKGVISVTPGYAGGHGDNPSYTEVSTGKTGFAEAVQIQFDPQVIKYSTLLDIFWATHDPTTLNQQGTDIGTQYRSSIFYHDNKQKESAEESKQRVQDSSQTSKQIMTEIKPLDKFFTAEDYHKNYYNTNKDLNSYCSIVIDPKIEKLISQFNDQVKEEYRK